MNSSQYMDKQIMDLSNSQSNNGADFINLMNRDEDDAKREEIMPSYDFQPIRPNSSPPPPNFDSANVAAPRVWTSADSKISSGVRNYASLDSTEPAKVIFEKDREIYDAALLSEIDRTMKKHADNLLHALEGVSARLSQLESRTRHLEHSVDDLKTSIGNNHGSADGKMRQLENILREVESGVHIVKDKQEILEAQLQVAKLQVSKVEQPSETPSKAHLVPVHPGTSTPPQSNHQLPPIALTSQPPNHSQANGPLPPQQTLPPAAQFPNQFSQNYILPPQQNAYFPTSGQAPESPIQHYQVPPQQQQLPPSPAPPQQQYQPSPVPQYSQPPPLPQQHSSLSAVNSPQPPLGQQPEETPYLASQNFQASSHQPPAHLPSGAHPSHLPSGAPPSHQFYGAPSHMYEPQSSRPGPGFSASYSPPSVPSEPYPYGGPPSQYGRGSPVKAQLLPSSFGQSGGNAYPQLPTARILPHALPTASGVGSGSSSSGTGNKVPIDDVVDKVTTMGFPRDHVRTTVQRLTEDGQSVDLNVVLDKLMNGGDVQPPRGGRFDR